MACVRGLAATGEELALTLSFREGSGITTMGFNQGRSGGGFCDFSDGATKLVALRNSSTPSSTSSSEFRDHSNGEVFSSQSSRKRRKGLNTSPKGNNGSKRPMMETKKSNSEKNGPQKSGRRTIDQPKSRKRVSFSDEIYKLRDPSPATTDGNGKKDSIVSIVADFADNSESTKKNSKHARKDKGRRTEPQSSSTSLMKKSIKSNEHRDTVPSADKVENEYNRPTVLMSNNSNIGWIKELEQELNAVLQGELPSVQTKTTRNNSRKKSTKSERKHSSSKSDRSGMEKMADGLAESSKSIQTKTKKNDSKKNPTKSDRKQSSFKYERSVIKKMAGGLAESSESTHVTKKGEKHRRDEQRQERDSIRPEDGRSKESSDNLSADPRNVGGTSKVTSNKGSRNERHKKKSKKEKSKKKRVDRLNDVHRCSSDSVKSGEEYFDSKKAIAKRTKKTKSKNTSKDGLCDEVLVVFDPVERSNEVVGRTARTTSQKRKSSGNGKKKRKIKYESTNDKSQPNISSKIEKDRSPAERPHSKKAKKGSSKSNSSTQKSKGSSRHLMDPPASTNTKNLQNPHPSNDKKKHVSFHLAGKTLSPSVSRDHTSDVSHTKTSEDSKSDEAGAIRIVPPRSSWKNSRCFRSPSLFFKRKSPAKRAAPERKSKISGSLHSSMVAFNSTRSLQATHHRRKSFGMSAIFRGSGSSGTTSTSSSWNLRPEVSLDHRRVMEMVFFETTIRDE